MSQPIERTNSHTCNFLTSFFVGYPSFLANQGVKHRIHNFLKVYKLLSASWEQTTACTTVVLHVFLGSPSFSANQMFIWLTVSKDSSLSTNAYLLIALLRTSRGRTMRKRGWTSVVRAGFPRATRCLRAFSNPLIRSERTLYKMSRISG